MLTLLLEARMKVLVGWWWCVVNLACRVDMSSLNYGASQILSELIFMNTTCGLGA
jgi:hypothetical protein